MLDEESVTLSVTQADTFKKLTIVRAHLLDGYSDKQILEFCKTDPLLKVQDRRGREILSLAYELFADLRIEKPQNGVKYLHAEIFKEAAKEIYAAAKEAKEAKDFKGAASLFREWRAVRFEAAKIEKVFDPEEQDNTTKKQPKKVVFKKVIVNNNYASGENSLPANIPIDIPHTEE